MKKRMILVAALLLSTPAFAADDWGAAPEKGQAAWGDQAKPTTEVTAASNKTCVQDDPRMANIVPVLQAVRAGKKIEPVKMSVKSYLDMKKKVRDILGDNIVIVTPSCKDNPFFEGELLSKVELPFPNILNLIDRSIHQKDINQINFIFKNVKAASASANEIVNFSMSKVYSLADAKVLMDAAHIEAIGSDKEHAALLLTNLYVALGGKWSGKGNGNINVYVFNAMYTSIVVNSIYTDSEHVLRICGSENIASAPINCFSFNQVSESYSSLGLHPVVTNR